MDICETDLAAFASNSTDVKAPTHQARDDRINLHAGDRSSDYCMLGSQLLQVLDGMTSHALRPARFLPVVIAVSELEKANRQEEENHSRQEVIIMFP